MTALIPRGSPAPLAPPPLPPRLQAQLGRWLVDRSDALQEAARDWLAAAAAAEAQLPQPREVEAWLLAVYLQVANRPAAEEVEIRTRGLLDLAADGRLPAFAFCDETRRLAIAEFRFWPSAAELLALLERWLARHDDRVQAVEAYLKRAQEPPPLPAIERHEPYEIPPAPDWAVRRGLPRGEDAVERAWLTHPPVRTVAEQLAALGYREGVVPVRPVQPVPVMPVEEASDD